MNAEAILDVLVAFSSAVMTLHYVVVAAKQLQVLFS